VSLVEFGFDFESGSTEDETCFGKGHRVNHNQAKHDSGFNAQVVQLSVRRNELFTTRLTMKYTTDVLEAKPVT
jgi:hypothetical protein